MSFPKPAPLVSLLTALTLLSSGVRAQCPAWTVDALVPQFDDRLGSAVAGRGDTWVVGLPGHFGEGQALVQAVTAEGAVQAALLWPSDLSFQDQFGAAVAIDGDVIAVGAPGDDDGSFGAGSVYVFERVLGAWLQTDKLQAAVPGASASFGSAVAVGDDWIAVGAPFDSGAAPIAGRVSLFQKTPSGWVLRQEETGAAAFERYGSALSIAGGTLAVGAPGVGVGRVELLAAAQTMWLPGPQLVPIGAADGAEFGGAVDLFGNRLLVGARSDKSFGLVTGAAYVFSDLGLGWQQRQRLGAQGAADHDRFGASVSIDDEWLLVGAPGGDSAAPNGGQAHIFRENPLPLGVVWTEHARITPLGAQAEGGFGSALSLDKFRMWIGSPEEDTDAGDAGRVFTYTMSEVGCAPLSVGPLEVSASAPTKLEFQLNPGLAFAGLPYFLLGSASGSSTPTLVGGLPLPLTSPDAYGNLLLFGANHGAMDHTLGFLDATGSATASIDLAKLGYPLLQGMVLDHAYFVFSGGTALFVSPSAPVEIIF